jgi:gas vesicle protein
MNKPSAYVDSLLENLGLERRRAFFGTLVAGAALVTVGVMVGAGIGLMVAPSSGRRLRQDFGDRLDQLKNRFVTDARRREGILNATTGTT